MKNLYSLLIKAVFALMLMLPAISGTSVIDAQNIDSKGKDFWITFIPNFHNNLAFGEDSGDSLFIFITSEKPTIGTIEYYNRNGIMNTEAFSISNTSKVYMFKVSFWQYELFGYNNSGTITSNRYQSELVSKMSFHVRSNEEVTVYAHNQAETTSEAFLVIPTDALGTEHFVMSYKSDGTTYLGDVLGQSTPSEFAIVSAEDNNYITIEPSAPTRYHKDTTQTVTLDKGEVYLVQADITVDNLRSDLTGTHITSTKPLALFCGHQRATIPIENKGGNSSRDMLIEQIPPVNTWGQNSFLVPYRQHPSSSPEGSDLYRIMSGSDGNRIRINNSLITTLDKGKYYEAYLSTPGVVTADGPILVVQYKKTSSFDGSSFAYSDPFIMVMPPKEQFTNSYRIINLQSYENSYNKIYTDQNITVIVPDNGIATFKLDNALVAASLFYKINNSGYSYAHFQVSDGVHELTCDRSFGVFVYGYGYANSYGYVGGMSFTPLDQPPVFAVIDSCYSAYGVVHDSAAADSGILEVTSSAESEENINLTISAFQKLDKLVTFSASLKDIFNDGKCKIIAKDTAGNTSSRDVNIPGFTVAHPDAKSGDILPVYSPVVVKNKEFCFRIPVLNYGSFNQLIKSLSFKVTELTIKYSTPKTIKPGVTDSVEVCVLKKDENSTLDTLFLEGPCGIRPIAIINIDMHDCDESMIIFPDFADDNFIRYNGSAKRVIDRIRLTPSKPITSGMFWRTLQMPVRKGFVTEFAFSVSEGYNHTGTEKSLPGADGIAFVIQNAGLDAIGGFGGGIGYENIPNSVAIEFDLFQNDSTQLFDYYDPNGNHLAVQSMGHEPNTAKHVKEATLGITETIMTIKPNGMPYYARIEYNMEPDRLSIYLNKTKEFTTPVLVVNNFKIENYLTLERGEWAFVGFTAATANSYEMHDILSWYFCPKRTDSQQTDAEDANTSDGSVFSAFPNPFDSDININFTSSTPSVAEVSIYNLLGEKIATVFNSHVEPGTYSLTYDGKLLAPGLYICNLKIGGKNYIHNIIRLSH